MSSFSKNSINGNFWNIEFKNKSCKNIENLIPEWKSEYTDDFCSKKISSKSKVFENGLQIEICAELFYNESFSDYFKSYSNSCKIFRENNFSDNEIVLNVNIGSCSENIQKSINSFSINENGVFLKINSLNGESVLNEVKKINEYMEIIKSRLIMEAMS